MFSVTIAVSSLSQDPARAGGRVRKRPAAQVRPFQARAPFPQLPGRQPWALRVELQLFCFSILLPNRKVNKQLTFTNALLLGYFFLYSPDVLKCAVPDASPPTG